MEWHQKAAEAVLIELGTGPDGLTPGEARTRVQRYGPNRLAEARRRSGFSMLLAQFTDFMIIVLIAAAIVAGAIGEAVDTVAILVIVILNAVIGFVQEYRAEKALEALKRIASPNATVVRNGQVLTIDAAHLVPGDMVLLEAGNIVPADMRLAEAVRLRIDESILTGESVPVEKQTGPVADPDIPVGERTNMIYRGTTVTYGRGKAAVTATGMDTELGGIARMIRQQKGVRTPLQRRLAAFGGKLAIAVLVICALVLAVGLLRGEPFFPMLLTAISLAVAAIPEALPAVVTISLALGAKRMVRQNALIRHLPAVETLGSVTYICSDKTGTLTQNRMTVSELFCDGRVFGSGEIRDLDRDSDAVVLPAGDPVTHLLVACALNNDSRIGPLGEVVGDPTETALYAVARSAGLDKSRLESRYPRVDEIPFDSGRKRMTTFHGTGDSTLVSFTKGAPEQVIPRCSGGESVRAGALQENDRMALAGMRVLAFAMRRWNQLPGELSAESAEAEMSLLGLVGIIDPPRAEARDAVLACRRAGIVPVMITGDHPATARAIARQVGIVRESRDRVMTGAELADTSPEELREAVESIKVYARVSPEQKLSILRGLRDRGHYTAMTGDGVNDAPALKAADIGVAMGITGTDVAKEAAHMVLLDDNFATIVNAVKEGRRIFDNIRKFIKYTMISNSGEIWTILLAPLLGLPVPLFPIHILWINLVTDGLPGLALSVEPPERNVMTRPPRPPGESIFAHGLGVDIVWVGLLMGGVSILTEVWTLRTGLTHWRTMVFTVLCLSQMGNVLALRSERESLFKQGLFTNRPLTAAFLLTLVLQMATIYVPFLNPVFRTEPLPGRDLAIALGLSSVVFVAVEIRKWIARHRLPANGGKPA